MAKLLTVEVVKSKWHRGDSTNSALRLDNGGQCCIGFLARTLGAKTNEILDTPRLADTDNAKCLGFNSKFDNQLSIAYSINDSPSITDTMRIKKLKVIGKKMGVKFVFVP